MESSDGIFSVGGVVWLISMPALVAVTWLPVLTMLEGTKLMLTPASLSALSTTPLRWVSRDATGARPKLVLSTVIPFGPTDTGIPAILMDPTLKLEVPALVVSVPPLTAVALDEICPNVIKPPRMDSEPAWFSASASASPCWLSPALEVAPTLLRSICKAGTPASDALDLAVAAAARGLFGSPLEVVEPYAAENVRPRLGFDWLGPPHDAEAT